MQPSPSPGTTGAWRQTPASTGEQWTTAYLVASIWSSKYAFGSRSGSVLAWPASGFNAPLIIMVTAIATAVYRRNVALGLGHGP